MSSLYHNRVLQHSFTSDVIHQSETVRHLGSIRKEKKIVKKKKNNNNNNNNKSRDTLRIRCAVQEYTHYTHYLRLRLWTLLSLLTKPNPNRNPRTFLKFVELIGKLCLRLLFLILPHIFLVAVFRSVCYLLMTTFCKV